MKKDEEVSKKDEKNEELVEIEWKELSKEQKKEAKKMVKKLLKVVRQDPDFRYISAIQNCFKATVWTFLAQCSCLLFLRGLNPVNLGFIIGSFMLLLVFDMLSMDLDENFRKLYFRLNVFIHVLNWILTLLILRTMQPEIILGLDFQTFSYCLILFSVCYPASEESSVWILDCIDSFFIKTETEN